MGTYKCDICGKNHEILRGIETPQPERILKIPESEIAQRVKQIQDSFIIDDQLFLLKGDIFIYKADEKDPYFNWSVWVSISLADFQSKADELSQRKNVEFNGQLETDIPFYYKTKGLKVKATINLNYDYAVIKIDTESQIKKDQTGSISKKRVIELMQMIHHNPSKN